MILRGRALAALVIIAAAASGCTTVHKIVHPPYEGPKVVLPNNCTDMTATIYFDRGSSTLTSDAKAALKIAAGQAETCGFRAVDVYGLSDAVGAPAANIAISKRRAEAVTRQLAQLGFTAVTFKLVAAGDAGATNAEGEVEPLRRRADVIFRANPGS